MRFMETLMILCLLSIGALAQEFRATINGRVTDAAGAASGDSVCARSVPWQ